MSKGNEANIQLLVAQAISEIQNLKPDDKPFMVRDLFLGYEWNRLSNYIRAQVGARFYHQHAKDDSISQVIVLNKTARNQQLYRKK